MRAFCCVSGRLLCIAEETLTEFLSKATGTAVEWIQMPGMKVIQHPSCLLITVDIFALIEIVVQNQGKSLPLSLSHAYAPAGTHMRSMHTHRGMHP